MGHLKALKGRMVGVEDLMKEGTDRQGGEGAEVKEGRKIGAVLEQTATSEQ